MCPGLPEFLSVLMRPSANRNSVYEKFILDYAGVEDEIRKIWVRLLEEQQVLLVRSPVFYA